VLELMKFFKKPRMASKDIAANRLKVCIIHDKTQGSPEILDMIRNEIIKVIENYVEFDRSALEVQITHSDCSDGKTAASALVANIPIKSIKRIGK
jgi:cell division topological specificity factor